jgi:hypothetical protein
MPGHFTHIYMARRLADWLSSQKSFNPDDVVGIVPGDVSEALGAGALGLMGSANQLTPERAAQLMRDWPKFTALGAVGPDLFFYCQDFSSESFTEHAFPDDLLMLAMRVVYSLGRNSHESMRPLAALLAEANQVFAGIVRVLIKLESIWDDFVSVYSGAIDPVTNLLAAAVDSVSGGVVTEAGKAFDNVLSGIKRVLAEEVATSDDFFAPFALRARNGWDEKSFAWSDMLHYRKTSQMPRNLLIEASRQFDLDHDRAKFEQFQAFALGWISHVGTDVIGHSFVNEQAGGPFRTHWQRHHLVENHMDAWIYREAGEGGCLTSDPLGANDIYPDIGQSALVFALALDDANPGGWERPVTLPADAMEARDAVELSGEMPQWLAEGILQAMIATYHVGGDTEPENLGGDDFSITSPSTLAALENLLTGADVTVNEPLGQLVECIAKPAGFDVPRGYPQPWEIQVSYRFMLTYYQLAFWGGFDLARPRSPAFIEWPSVTSKPSEPSSASPEARSSNEGSPGWAMDVLGKLGGDIGPGLQRLGEIVRAASSPGSFPLRYALYQIALWGWDMLSRAHNILAHTGFVLPHGERTYADTGELMLSNEIDLGLITLGATADPSFVEMFASSVNVISSLDFDAALIGPRRDPRPASYPFLPVRPEQLADLQVGEEDRVTLLSLVKRGGVTGPDEFKRPWTHPDQSRRRSGELYPTPGELSDIAAELEEVGRLGDLQQILEAGVPLAAGTVSGPYPAGATPADVLFRTGKPVDATERSEYENAVSPAHTDALNERLIGRSPDQDRSPLGDPLQFCAYLIGRISSEHCYEADFNMDADRGYGYRCWDWIRSDDVGVDHRSREYRVPRVPPEGARASRGGSPGATRGWSGAAPDAVQVPLQLRYLDQRDHSRQNGSQSSASSERRAGEGRPT